jgi:hypothetical protein
MQHDAAAMIFHKKSKENIYLKPKNLDKKRQFFHFETDDALKSETHGHSRIVVDKLEKNSSEKVRSQARAIAVNWKRHSP